MPSSGDYVGAAGIVAGVGMMGAASVASGAPGADLAVHAFGGPVPTFLAGLGTTTLSIASMIFK